MTDLPTTRPLPLTPLTIPEPPRTAPAPWLTAGQLVGPYRLARLRGAGTFGSTWDAQASRCARPLVAKVASTELAEPIAQAFLDRARRLSTVAHPSLATVIDHGIDAASPWLAMIAVPGDSLRTLVERSGAMNADRVVAIGSMILGALDVLHAAGVVHGDVSPANVRVTFTLGGVHATLVDLGLPRCLAMGSSDTKPFPSTLPAHAFLAPEATHAPASHPRADLFGLGATLDYAVRGRAAASATDPLAGRGEWLRDVIARACAPDASDRFESAVQMAGALQRTAPLADVPPRTRPAKLAATKVSG